MKIFIGYIALYFIGFIVVSKISDASDIKKGIFVLVSLIALDLIFKGYVENTEKEILSKMDGMADEIKDELRGGEIYLEQNDL